MRWVWSWRPLSWTRTPGFRNGVLGFARGGAQHRPARPPRGRPQPRHAGRGRADRIRRGAPQQAPGALAHRRDAAPGVRAAGAARRARRCGARGGAAAAGGSPPGRGPRVRRRGPASGASRRAAAVRAVAPRGARGAAGVRLRRGAARRPGRVRRRATARRQGADRAPGAHAGRERHARWRGVRLLRRGIRGAAAAAGRVRGRDAPHVLPGDGKRALRVARRPARSAPPLMPPLDGFDFAALAGELTALGADGWLLFDFRGVNPVAQRVLAAGGMGTRRLFVLLPRAGRPVARAHRIQLQPLEGFPGEVRPYSSWRELHAHLQALVAGRTLAMEVSPQDAVPYLDRVPHGVVQLLESLGARVVPSAPLVTRFAARWTAADLDGHRRAAHALAEIAQQALAWAGGETAGGAEVRETTLQRRVAQAIERAGFATDHPPIVGLQQNSALP